MFNFFKKQVNKEVKEVKKDLKPFDTSVIPDYEQKEFNQTEIFNANFRHNVWEHIIKQKGISLDSGVYNCDYDFSNGLIENILGNEIIFSHFGKQGFIGFSMCAVLCQDWLINKACSIPAKDALIYDYQINVSDDNIDKDTLKQITDLKKYKPRNNFNIENTLRAFAEKKRQFGQALCIPLIDGVDYSLPFNIDAISPYSYKGMRVIDPIWAQPILDIESATNPLSARYYKPTYFKIGNEKPIHYSWFIFETLNEVADILKPTYYYGGVPLPQMLYKQVYAAEKTGDEAPMLMQSKRLNYMDGNLNAYLLGEKDLKKELKALSYLRNNWGWILKKPDQTIGQIDTSLTDVDTVTMLEFQLVAAIAGMPSSRLLETSPKGWQSSGSYEDEQYKRLLMNIHTQDFAPILNYHYRLLAKSLLNLDIKFDCKFDPVDQPTEKELAEINKINADTDSVYINAGVVSPDEVRERIRQDNQSQYQALSDEMPEMDFADLLNDNEETETKENVTNDI